MSNFDGFTISGISFIYTYWYSSMAVFLKRECFVRRQTCVHNGPLNHHHKKRVWNKQTFSLSFRCSLHFHHYIFRSNCEKAGISWHLISTKTLNDEQAENKRPNNNSLLTHNSSWTTELKKWCKSTNWLFNDRRERKKHSLFRLHSMFTPKLYVTMTHTSFLFCWFYHCSVLIINLKMAQCENIHNERAFKLGYWRLFASQSTFFLNIFMASIVKKCVLLLGEIGYENIKCKNTKHKMNFHWWISLKVQELISVQWDFIPKTEFVIIF